MSRRRYFGWCIACVLGGGLVTLWMQLLIAIQNPVGIGTARKALTLESFSVVPTANPAPSSVPVKESLPPVILPRNPNPQAVRDLMQQQMESPAQAPPSPVQVPVTLPPAPIEVPVTLPPAPIEVPGTLPPAPIEVPATLPPPVDANVGTPPPADGVGSPPPAPGIVDVAAPSRLRTPRPPPPNATRIELDEQQRLASKVLNRDYGLIDANDPQCWVPLVDDSNPPRCAPYWFVIGAFKCGTTSLFKYLAYHPNVKLSDVTDASRVVRVKEPGLFGKKDYISIAMWKGYLKGFPDIFPGDHKVSGEATPNYIFQPLAAPTMQKTVPRGKFIALLRDPVERAFSQINHYTRLNRKDVTDESMMVLFDALVDGQLDNVKKCEQQLPADVDYSRRHDCWMQSEPKERPDRILGQRQRDARAGVKPGEKRPIPGGGPLNMTETVKRDQVRLRGLRVFDRGLYIYQIRYWQKFFGPDQLMIVKSEDLFNDEIGMMTNITRFLELPEFDWSVIQGTKFNVAKQQSPGKARGRLGLLPEQALPMEEHAISPRARLTLQKFYAPYNAMLEAHLGRPMWRYPHQDQEGQQQQQQQELPAAGQDAQQPPPPDQQQQQQVPAEQAQQQQQQQQEAPPPEQQQQGPPEQQQQQQAPPQEQGWRPPEQQGTAML